MKFTRTIRIRIAVIVFFGFLSVLTAGILFNSHYFSAGKNSGLITLDATGFTPYILLVGKGADVVFQNHTGTYFWPASNTHPLHTRYPAFDAKSPIASNDKWNFKFDQAGIWHYHDHLRPNAKGIVIVVAGNKEYTSLVSLIGRSVVSFFSSPKQLEDMYKKCINRVDDAYTCWNNELSDFSDRNGVIKALEGLKTLRESYATVANRCHQYSDFLGELGYWNIPRLSRWSQFDPALAAQCSAGYMHGFMSEYVSHGSSKEAGMFCEKIRTTYPNQALLYRECIRGFGNGLSFRYGLIYWNQEEVIINKAIADCKGQREEQICIDGVYSGLDHMYFGVHGFTITMNSKDPFGLCANRSSKEDTNTCYAHLTPSFFGTVAKYDSELAIKYVMRIPREYITPVVGRIAVMLLEKNADPLAGGQNAVAWCRKFHDTDSDTCLEAMVEKLMFVDNDSGKNVLAQQFCQSAYLTSHELQICQNYLSYGQNL